MSEWQKVSNLVTFGSTWNIHGIGKTYVESVSTFTQEVNLWIDAGINGAIRGNAGFWFPGNGVDSYLVGSATISYGGETRSLKVNGRTAFYVPKEGRWSDWVSIYDWAWGHSNEYISVTFTFSIASTSAKIPTAPAAPSTPVGVSAYEYKIITEDLPETELNEEVGDLVTSLPFVENFINLDNWAIGETSVTPTISEGLYINLPKLTEPGHGKSTDIRIFPFMSHLPSKFSFEIITNCDSVPISSWCNIIIYLYTLDFTFVGVVPAITPDAPFEILYKPLENKIQKWRWEIDTTNTGRPIERIYYDDELITEIAAAGYFISATSGVAGLQIEANNHYDTGADLRLHIKSITITDGITDRSLSEVTATSTITLTTNPAAGDTLTISGGTGGNIVFTFVDHYPNNSTEIQIGANANATATNVAAALNNITGAEFTATVVNNVITVTAYTSLSFSMSTTSAGITTGSITEIIPGFNEEDISVADSFTATEGGKSVQENVSVTDSIDGLIDGLPENITAASAFDAPLDDITESASVSTDIDGLIDYFGEEEL